MCSSLNPRNHHGWYPLGMTDWFALEHGRLKELIYLIKMVTFSSQKSPRRIALPLWLLTSIAPVMDTIYPHQTNGIFHSHYETYYPIIHNINQRVNHNFSIGVLYVEKTHLLFGEP